MRSVRKHGFSGACMGALVMAGLVGGWAMPAQAQEQQDEQNQTVMVPEEADGNETAAVVLTMLQELEAVSIGLGQKVTPVPVDLLTRVVRATMPALPETDSRDWGSSIQFELTSGYVQAAASEGVAAQGDARNCAPASMVTARVVDFRRFEDGEISGDQCVLQGLDGDIWALHSTTVAEGQERRILATYGVAILVDAEPEASTALGDAYLQANLALAAALTDFGLAVLEAAETGVERDPLASLVRLDEMIAGSSATSAP